MINSNLKALARKLASWRKNNISDAFIGLYFNTEFITPGMLVMITSWALEMRLRNIQFAIRGVEDTLHYLDRMGFHQAIGAHPLYVPQYAEAGRFLPLHIVKDTKEQTLAVDHVCELILKQFENARALLPAFEWAVNEITDNVFTHAQSPTPCVLEAQYYPSTRQLEIAIADQGLGLLGTLGPAHGAMDEVQAIELALTRGLTRDPKIGQGNGLAGTESIVDCNSGELFMWTGKTSMVRTEERTYNKFYDVNGVGVILRLKVDNPIDLNNMWIAGSAYTYIDSYAEDIDNGMPLFVRDECNSTGSREPARRLRNKILALLPDVENTILINFADCNSPSSSFLDELFGRLILEIGLQTYHKKIEIAGLDATSFGIANNVIDQRLQYTDTVNDLIDYGF